MLLEAIAMVLDPSLNDELPSFNEFQFHTPSSKSQQDKELAISLRINLSDLQDYGPNELELFPGLKKGVEDESYLFDIQMKSGFTDSGIQTSWICTNLRNGLKSDNPLLLKKIRQLLPLIYLGKGALIQYNSKPSNTENIEAGSIDNISKLRADIQRHASDIIQGKTLDFNNSVNEGFNAIKLLVEATTQPNENSSSEKPSTPKLREILQMVSVQDSENQMDLFESFDDFADKLGVLLFVNSLIINSLPDLDSHGTPLLIFEMPEAFLHKRTLAAIGVLVNKIKWQKIFTTNSGWLLSLVPFNAIRKIRRVEDQITSAKINVSQFSNEELRRISYNLKVQNKAAPFARFWILVEGESEQWILPHLARIMGYSLFQEGISVMDFAQTGLKPLIKFAEDIGIGWHVLIDGDEAGIRFRSTVDDILKDSTDDSRFTQLEESDIEHHFWHHKLEAVFVKIAKLTKVPKTDLHPTKTINRAINKSSKPHLALRIIEEISSRGKEAIPPPLYSMITSCIERARSY